MDIMDIYGAIVKSEPLIASLIEDELLMRRIEEHDPPWVYKLGRIMRKRIE